MVAMSIEAYERNLFESEVILSSKILNWRRIPLISVSYEEVFSDLKARNAKKQEEVLV